MTINSKLKYIRLNDNKRPIDKWKEEKNQYFSCDDLRNAALVIPKDVVVIDFDGDNIDSYGEVKESCIYRYILEKYRPYWVKSKSNHIHLYFKKPIELNIENWVDYITLGGFQVDYRTDGGYAVIKTQNKMRDSSQTLTKDVIDNLPELPKICYPLYSNKKKQTSMIGMKDGDGRDDEIFKHISIATSKYPDIDIKEAILFLNKEIFNDPLDETIVLNKIERAKQSYLENPFTFYKKIYNGTQLSDDGPKEFNIVCFDNIKTEIPKWLWYPYLPLGTIVLLVGDPGVGKTYIALWIASLISNGQEFPFNEENKNEKIGPSNVLFQNGEDGVSYTLKLRLENLGANSKNIYMIDESQSMFHLNDLSLFEETLKRLRPKLVIIDPIQRYIPTGKSMDKANDVRSALSPIRDLAEKYECTVLIIMHRNKGNSNGKIPSLYRALGSIDFVGTARGMLTAEQTNKGKVVYQTKNSLGVIGEPLMYEISDDGFKIIGKFKDNGDFSDKDKKIDIAKKFIQSKIKDEPMLSTELLYQALENDISQSTYDRARKEIGTVSIQSNNQWYTCLDEKSAKIFKEKLKENAKNY